MPISVAIADDHPMVIDGISNILRTEPEIKITATYQSGASLLNGLLKDKPDVLLIDIHFPDMTGSELSAIIMQKYPSIRMLVITSVDNPYTVIEMMRNGCSGYLLKSVAPAVLVKAVLTVNKGEEFIEPGLQQKVFQSMVHPSQVKSNATLLTKREEEILVLICEGLTNYEIGDKLFLSHRTIENHRQTLYSKCGVKHTATLVKSALQRGFVK